MFTSAHHLIQGLYLEVELLSCEGEGSECASLWTRQGMKHVHTHTLLALTVYGIDVLAVIYC